MRSRRFSEQTLRPTASFQCVACVPFTINEDDSLRGKKCTLEFVDGLNGTGVVPVRNLVAIDNSARRPRVVNTEVVVSDQAGGQASFQRGDANGNGIINVTDASFVLNYLFLGGPAPPCAKSADSDDDGQLQIADAVGLLGFLFLGGSAPAEPSGRCGTGPNPGQSDMRGLSPVRVDQWRREMLPTRRAWHARREWQFPSGACDSGLRSLVERNLRAGTLFRGDCNFSQRGQGTPVDVADAAAVMSSLFAQGLDAFAPSCEDACDCDDNGIIDANDALCILSYLFQSGGFPASPGPGFELTDGGVRATAPGLDPTLDGLTCVTGEEASGGENCNNDIDDDGDGWIDLQDPDCARMFACGSREDFPFGQVGSIRGSIGSQVEVSFFINNPEDDNIGDPRSDHIQGFSMALSFCCDLVAEERFDISDTILEALNAEFVRFGRTTPPTMGTAASWSSECCSMPLFRLTAGG